MLKCQLTYTHLLIELSILLVHNLFTHINYFVSSHHIFISPLLTVLFIIVLCCITSYYKYLYLILKVSVTSLVHFMPFLYFDFIIKYFKQSIPNSNQPTCFTRHSIIDLPSYIWGLEYIWNDISVKFIHLKHKETWHISDTVYSSQSLGIRCNCSEVSSSVDGIPS